MSSTSSTSSLLLAGLSPDDLAILFEPNPYSYDSTLTDPSRPSPFVQAMREQEEMFFAAFPEARKAAEYRERRKEQLLAFLASRNANFSPPTRAYCRQGSFDCHHPTATVAASTAPLNHTTYETLIYEDVPQPVPATPTVYYQTHDAQPESRLPPRQHSLHRIKEEPESKPQITLPTCTPTPQQQQQQQPHSPTHHDRHSQKGGSQHVNKDKPTSTIRRARGADRVDRPSKLRPSTPKPSCTARPRLTKISNPSGSKRRVGPQPGKRPRQPRQPRQLDGGKPTLACLFCRGRKIACGAPLPGSMGKTCNQCQRRSLRCEFPAESRRGVRKRKMFSDSDEGPEDQSSLLCESILSP